MSGESHVRHFSPSVPSGATDSQSGGSGALPGGVGVDFMACCGSWRLSHRTSCVVNSNAGEQDRAGRGSSRIRKTTANHVLHPTELSVATPTAPHAL